ncbi:class I SAM-dependent methyltransferase [Nocardia brasiliensis]|uniref:class I SAM-dependent methyltransferase n=1 Tax=Nocardia brasiliensis TaxID=37326 RepID=UPI002B4B4F4C|nr:methyltransferase domain-containing protein [Nocardia brasiliensis]MBF6541937.1 methyltransferase domain-containing protein [Nocardia brasiliensis]
MTGAESDITQWAKGRCRPVRSPVGLLYRMAYRAGITPWDTGRAPAELVDLVQGADALTPGRALDLGCGTGTNAIYLARHGWQVTGVDLTPHAIAKARRRAQAAGMELQLVAGDATRLPELDIGEDYGLILDLGCYHSLFPAALREDYARGVTAVAAASATLLLYGFLPGRLSANSITTDELRTRFPGWQLTHTSRGRNWLPTEAFRLQRVPVG